MGNSVVRRGLPLAASLILAVPGLCGDRVIGGFDLARGGDVSLTDGSFMGQVRAAIDGAFPKVSLTSAPLLTPEYLATVDVVILSSVTTGCCAITPLSPDEQAALVDFVSAGGNAILLADNSSVAGTGPDSANWSLVSPFGFTTDGTNVNGPADIVRSDPVTDGPFGTVSTFMPLDGGYLSQVPLNALVLGEFQDGTVALAASAPGAIGPGSGLLVVYSDSSLLFDWLFDDSAQSLLLNALSLVFPPEPCYPDCTQDDSLDLFDFLCYVGAFNIGLDVADCDGDGGLDVFDFLCFVNEFNAGC